MQQSLEITSCTFLKYVTNLNLRNKHGKVVNSTVYIVMTSRNIV